MSARLNKTTFYILSFTWGLLMTAVGAVVALGFVISGHKPQKYGYCLCFEVGSGWGGMSLGLFIFVSKSSSSRTKNHECGHAVQNCYLGVLMPFVVCIPSAIRYWYRKFRYSRRGKTPPTSYDDIWFEGSATTLGNDLYQWLSYKEERDKGHESRV